MKVLNLEREKSTTSETMGRLSFETDQGVVLLHTVEQEWRSTHPGGQPNNSCVPAGRYSLISHLHHGKKVVALVNPGHGVYYEDLDRPQQCGRFMILIHPGNTVQDVVGCIAPGQSRQDNFVGSSRNAMRVLMDFIDDDEEAIINITWADGEP